MLMPLMTLVLFYVFDLLVECRWMRRSSHSFPTGYWFIDRIHQAVPFLLPGDVFGELALLYNCPRAASVEAFLFFLNLE